MILAGLLAAAALALPAEKPDAKDLVDLQSVVPDVVLDLRYASSDNLFGKAVYPAQARCLLGRATAEKLRRVADRLRAEDGTRLRVFDCYRPQRVQRQMWKLYPVRGYVAPPVPGSIHNRGAAVDLTLADASGKALPMPTDFDTFSEKAWHSYQGGPPETLRNRGRLERAMKAEGFTTVRKEWWHYEDPQGKAHPVLDVPFEAIQPSRP